MWIYKDTTSSYISVENNRVWSDVDLTRSSNLSKSLPILILFSLSIIEFLFPILAAEKSRYFI